jgi:AcrR family transcriptional regulator
VNDSDRRGRGRPSIPVEERRSRLFEAAERCFDSSRYESVTVNDIVREAGISSRSFYELFVNKEQLVIELAIHRGDEFVARLESVVAECDTALEAVERSLAAFLESLPWVILDLERMSGSVSQRAREVRDLYRAKISEVLMRHISTIAASVPVSPKEVPDPMSMLVVLAGIEGLAVRFYQEGRPKELRALHPQLVNALRRFFPSLVSDAVKIPK